MLIRVAACSGALAVAAGAFGAHAVTGPAAEWLKTGAMYQMVHAVAAIAIAAHNRRAAWLMIAGAAVFAGSLYAMALGAPRWFGAITPVGGLALIAGWLWLAFSRTH
jgi:uncharacterized membrane protein YgdD (TMEM256/DUF423 family)